MTWTEEWFLFTTGTWPVPPKLFFLLCLASDARHHRLIPSILAGCFGCHLPQLITEQNVIHFVFVLHFIYSWHHPFLSGAFFSPCSTGEAYFSWRSHTVFIFRFMLFFWVSTLYTVLYSKTILISQFINQLILKSISRLADQKKASIACSRFG